MKTYGPEATQALQHIGYALGMACVAAETNPIQSAICHENAARAMDLFQECENAGELP
jgi:hypothetical protein